MLRSTPLACACLLVLACGSESEGDDLPAGAFTSGPDDNGNEEEGSDEGTTSAGPVTTGDASTSDPPMDTGSEDTGPVVLSHDADILPIWTANCIDSSCHDSDGPASGLDLQTEGVYTRICDGFQPLLTMNYIDCEDFDPQSSYIFHKVSNTHADVGGSGGPMPPGPSLSDSDLATIENWILGGALP